MTYPKSFPGATWVGSKLPGKPWVGTTTPMVVLHTLEFHGWPDPDKWDAPAHLVYNPDTREIRQYLPMDLSAYSVRDNALEDDRYTWQVELWGKAANVPGYSDQWYEGVAALCQAFHDEYDIPLTFADFSNVAVAYPGATPDRMNDDQCRAFSGFLGHCHMGLGVDTHWDPGRLDTDSLLKLLEPPNYRDVINVPDAPWAEDVLDDNLDAGLIITTDDYVDDWNDADFKMGRLWIMTSRMMAALRRYVDQQIDRRIGD